MLRLAEDQPRGLGSVQRGSRHSASVFRLRLLQALQLSVALADGERSLERLALQLFCLKR
ncbi:hypothetical protein D9M71_652860 [compost metagenome]